MEEKKQGSTTDTRKWKKVTIGGISCIALGTAGTLFAKSMPLSGSTEETNSENTNEATNTTAQIATHITDSMTFTEAYNAAREEVGAGGVFEWHGNLYSTYTTAEWNNMDAAARGEFAESIRWDGPSHEYVTSSQNQEAHSTHTSHTAEVHHADTNAQNPNKDEEETPDVEIIGIEHANIDGEHNSIIGTANINGQSVYFIDVDGEDNEFELMVSDTNGNNQIDDGEVTDISDQHMSVSHFEQLAQAEQPSHNSEPETPVQYYANNEDLPDYVNDADPGTLA